jgi:Amt family ammonium transporter
MNKFMKSAKKAGIRASVARALASIFVGMGSLVVAAPAWAQESSINSGDTAWLLTSTALVLLMTIPGVALFYSGMVRKKNLLATLMQSFVITAVISVVWMVIGYSLAFSSGGGSFVGNLDMMFLKDLDVGGGDGIPDSLFIMFQMTFAIITSALITGAVAERMKFSSLLVFTVLWSIIVYAPITYWVWGGGFLGNLGVLDFAGGTVVHINSGVAALVAAIVLGKRLGYGKENLMPHNVGYTVIGASLLWVGWFGFNAGSALAADGAAGMAILVTQISTAGAVLSWMFVEWFTQKKPSVLGAASGAIAGLVAITPASGYVDPAGALAIGVIAGLVCYWGATSLKRIFGYDDSLDVFAVHGLGGITGAILTGVFAVEAIGGTPGGLEGNWGQVLIQIYGIGSTIIYCAVATAVLLMVIKATMGIRVEDDEERQGLDIALHGESVI